MIGSFVGLGGRLCFEYLIFLVYINEMKMGTSRSKKKDRRIVIIFVPLFCALFFLDKLELKTENVCFEILVI